jgi:tetratricopeptide (TPR) repeat protein
MPEKTVKCRLQDCNAALASDDGPIFSTVAKLVEALAVLLGEGHPESHYNLGLAYERRGLYGDAERQALASFRLNPDDPYTRNSLALIFAEEGKISRRGAADAFERDEIDRLTDDVTFGQLA